MVNPQTLNPAPAGDPTPTQVAEQDQKGYEFSLETLSRPIARAIVGIMVLLGAGKLVRRYAGPRTVSGGFIKTVVVLIVLGSLYDVYLVRFAVLGQDTVGWHVRIAVSRNVSRMKAEVQQAIERPLKPVRRTLQKANAASEREQEALRQITSDAEPSQ